MCFSARRLETLDMEQALNREICAERWRERFQRAGDQVRALVDLRAQGVSVGNGWGRESLAGLIAEARRNAAHYQRIFERVAASQNHA